MGTDDTASDRVDARADQLLPEETEAGSDDAQAQAHAILEESDDRQDDGVAGPDAEVEHRTSVDVTPPPDASL
jgi:hypothetical protein